MKTGSKNRDNEKERPLREALKLLTRLDKEIEKRVFYFISEIDKTYQN